MLKIYAFARLHFPILTLALLATLFYLHWPEQASRNERQSIIPRPATSGSAESPSRQG